MASAEESWKDIYFCMQKEHRLDESKYIHVYLCTHEWTPAQISNSIYG